MFPLCERVFIAFRVSTSCRVGVFSCLLLHLLDVGKRSALSETFVDDPLCVPTTAVDRGEGGQEGGG